MMPLKQQCDDFMQINDELNHRPQLNSELEFAPDDATVFSANDINVDYQNAPSLRERQRLLVAVDGGGTQTKCAVFDEAGRLLARGKAGPSNHFVLDRGKAFGSLKAAIHEAMVVCSADKNQIYAISAGLAGVDLRGEGLPEAQRYLESLGLTDKIIVHADIVTAHAGAFDCEPGILALAGTGSAFLGVTSDGKHFHAGGWGAIWGDEGSAYWIGRESLQAASAAYDGRGPATSLTDLICEALGLGDFTETLHAIYRTPTSVCLIAELSRVAEMAANRGDNVAESILKCAGDALASGIEAVVRRMRSPIEDNQMTWEGSVLRNSAIVRDQLCSSVSSRLPGISIAPPRFDPLYGAYLIGRRALDWETNHK